MSTREPSSNSQRTPRSGGFSAWVAAALVMGIESLALLGMAVWALYGIVAGTASTTTRAITEAVVLLILAGGVGLLAWFLLSRKSLAKTPTIVWNVLLLPVAWELYGGGASVLGVVLAIVAIAGIGAAIALPSYELADDEEEG